MSTFDERQSASESKFVLNAQLEFKSEARRNKMLGQWAAGLMGKTGDAVDKYALEVILADMEEAGDDDVFRKLRSDLDGANVEISDKGIRDKMAECLAAAREHFYGDKGA